MALADDIRVLAGAPVFSRLPEEALRLVAFGAVRRYLAEGEVLFQEGTPADSAYIVVSGRLGVLAADGSTTHEPAGPGSLISELALVSAVERKFTAIAERDCEVLGISRSLFRRLIEEYPQAGAIIEARIRENITRLASDAAALKARFAH